MPEFPADTIAQLVYAAPLITLLLALLFLAVPSVYARVFGILEREGRTGGMGEIRVCGGFLAGLSLSAFLFQDQPELPLTLGMALMIGAFGRILAMMSDHAAGLVNLVALLVQACLAGVLMTLLFDVWTPEAAFSVPTEPGALLSFWCGVVVATYGLIIMFAPRIALFVAGLDMKAGAETALGGVRSLGGMAVGTGLMVVLSGSIMLLLGFAVAMAGVLVGRALSLVLNRGNWIVQGISAVTGLLLLLPPLNYVFGMM